MEFFVDLFKLCFQGLRFSICFHGNMKYLLISFALVASFEIGFALSPFFVK